MADVMPGRFFNTRPGALAIDSGLRHHVGETERLVVCLCRGHISRMIRKQNDPSIRKKLWGGALWSPSYFAASCGGAPIEIIRRYIEQQQTPY